MADLTFVTVFMAEVSYLMGLEFYQPTTPRSSPGTHTSYIVKQDHGQFQTDSVIISKYNIFQITVIDLSPYFISRSLKIIRSFVSGFRVQTSSERGLAGRLHGYKFFAQATAVCPEPSQEIALAPQESASWEQRRRVEIMGDFSLENMGEPWTNLMDLEL
jgi:hypothetical protein